MRRATRAPRRIGCELLLARGVRDALLGPQLELERATLKDLEKVAKTNARIVLEGERHRAPASEIRRDSARESRAASKARLRLEGRATS
ncbi:MAG: hypothetical protein C4334_08380 [Pyrinomonas sp.]